MNRLVNRLHRNFFDLLKVMSDPLLLLRDAILAGTPISLDETDGKRFVIIGSQRLSVDTATRFMPKAGGGGKSYSLGAVWFLYENRALADQNFSKYFLEATTKKFPKVSLIDKKDVLDFLAGQGEIADHDVAMEDAVLPSVGDKRKADNICKSRSSLCVSHDQCFDDCFHHSRVTGREQ